MNMLCVELSLGILILVQRRSVLFHEVIKACKKKGLDVAGADRLNLMEEIAVNDLIAFLSFLSTPQDDLSLATVLKSPLFSWSEQRLLIWHAIEKRGLYGES